MLKQFIFITGFMGSGKSHLGQYLNSVYHLPFLDMDKEIEIHEGRSISQIFEETGEEFFRELELQFLLSLKDAHPAIISCGGGTPIDSRRRSLMKKLGKIVFLKEDLETIIQRIGNDSKRPLLKKVPAPELNDRISSLYDSRINAYLDCDVVLAMDRQTDELAATIHDLLIQA